MTMIDLPDAPWQDGFRAGDHGSKGVWTTDDLDAAIQDFSPAFEAAPINVDHIPDGASKGWIAALRRVGDLLQWKPRKIDAQLKADVDDEKFIRQSIELYRKHPKTGRPYVRGIALLGNAAPAVRGLRPVKFSDNTEGFNDEAGNEIVRLECSFSGGTMADAKKPQDQDGVTKFTAEEFQAAKTENVELKTKVGQLEGEIASFKANDAKKDAQIQAFGSQIAELQKFAAGQEQKAREAEVDAFLKGLTSGPNPKLTPAEAALERAALFHASREAVIPFGEKGEKFSQFDLMKKSLEARQPVAKFGDQVPGGDVTNVNGAEKFAEKARAAVLEAVKNGVLKSAHGVEAARYEAKVFSDLQKGAN